jgi:Flp pilus assembly secretin CpaC
MTKTKLVSLIVVLLVGIWPALAKPIGPCIDTRYRDLQLAEQKTSASVSSINLQTAGDTPVELHVLVGKSVILNSAQILKRVSVSDPTIALAVTVSPNQVLLNGLAPGKVSLILWNEQEKTFPTISSWSSTWASRHPRTDFPK